jgi:hypothetical protein
MEKAVEKQKELKSKVKLAGEQRRKKALMFRESIKKQDN